MELRVAGLNAAERSLAFSLEAGTVYGPEGNKDDDRPVVRSSFIRNLLRGFYPEIVPDPRGLRLRHVKIDGRLDLDRLETRIPLELDACELAQGLTAFRAHMPALALRGLQIDRASADEAVVDLEDLTVRHLDLTGTTLTNPLGRALMADGINVGSNAVLKNLITTGHGPDGAVCLIRATITGQLNLISAHLTNENGSALEMDGLTVGSAIFLRGLTSTGHGPVGTVRLTGATITGQLDLSKANLTNEKGPALTAGDLTVGSNAFFEGMVATGHGFDGAGDDGYNGAVRLPRATITGRLDLSNANLTNENGPALMGDRITVGASAHLGSLTAIGHGEDGAVRLHGANIAGQLDLSGANLTNGNGPALVGSWLTVGASAHLGDLTATGRDREGAVRLNGATITGELNLEGAKLDNEKGPALAAAGLTVGQDMKVDLVPSGTIPQATTSEHDNGEKQTKCTPQYALVDLSGADIGSTLSVSEATFDMAADGCKWDIDGLAYGGLDEGTQKRWLTFLRDGTRQYSPQPYQKFTFVVRAQGNERQAREALIAQHDHQLLRSKNQPELLNGWEKLGTRILQVTVGYGYRTWNALACLLGVIAIAAGIIFWLSPEALIQPEDSTAGNPKGTCATQDLWIITAETIPLVPLLSDTESACVTAYTPATGLYLFLIAFLKLVAWALLTLFIAGYTNIVRTPDR